MTSPITNCYDPKAARPRLAVERAYLYRPETEWTYSHHASITFFKGRFYAILSQDDVKAGRTFDDGIALGIFYLDAMSPDTDKRVYIPDAQGMVKFQPPPYHIPFRSLWPRGAKNLLAAGRCLSADQMALSSARVMTTASMMGQAAGIAAAMCADHQHPLAALDISRLRAELEKRHARL
jgi:hypothetical protein